MPQCHFDPAVMRCEGNSDSDTCLTAPQVENLKRLYAGAPVYYGWPVGSEFGYLGGWEYAIQGAGPVSPGIFPRMGLQGPVMGTHGFDWNRAPARVRAAIGAVVDAVDPDLRPFQAHGGKQILYHDWADPIGNAFDTIHYYEAVEHTVPDTPSFARLFLFPGMGHRRGGIGPNSFDAIGALDAWAEHGQPPAALTALKSPSTDEVGGLAIGSPQAKPGCTRPACP
ncbi:MAG TPA: tannase/feruloyl esterase family alpha/beta hydrolase [Acetobacteraceae bacterium]|nr:tannase/feruloyl esterase family alpha/beta hydrolase [Acetobacteraceae bacterium]